MNSTDLTLNQYFTWTFLLILVAFFWGSTFIIVKDALNSISPISFLMLRFVGTIILASLTIRWMYPQNWKELFLNKYGWVLGFILYLAFLFQTIGLKYTTPANAAFITALALPFVPVIMVIFFRKKIDRRLTFIWASLALVGIGLMTLDLVTIQFNPGDLVITLTAICVALQIIYTSEFSTKTSEGCLVLSQLFSMSIFSVFFFIIIEGSEILLREKTILEVIQLNPVIILALAITIVFATLFAFYIQTAAQKRSIPANYIVFIFAFEPIFALIMSLIVGSEPFTIQKGIGASIVFLAILGTILTQSRNFETTALKQIQLIQKDHLNPSFDKEE